MFFPFNLKLGAQVTFYAGVVVAFSAAAAWLRDDAKNDVRTEIRAEFSKQNEELLKEVARRVKKVDDLQRILQTTENEAASLLAKNNELLEKQRDAIPLSKACDSCLVPNERLWLRPVPKRTPASSSGRPGS
jgi:hypothetical protein